MIDVSNFFACRQLRHTLNRLLGPKIIPSTGNAGDENDPALKFLIPVISQSYKSEKVKINNQ